MMIWIYMNVNVNNIWDTLGLSDDGIGGYLEFFPVHSPELMLDERMQI